MWARYFIVAFCISIFASATVPCAVQQAVLIGVDRYAEESKIAPLKSAVSDAQGLASILSQNGYECRTLIDKEASKDQITEAFIQLEQKASQSGEPDIFIFYFSGRGTRVPDDIQADETLDNMDECILPFDAVAGDTLSYIRDDTLARWISAIKAKQTLIILDCSFWGNENNPAIKGFGELTVTGKADGIELADGLPENVMIVTASSPESSAMDGVYTAKLLQACASEDADINGDRRISFDEASQYAIRLMKGQQTPMITGNKDFNIPLATLPVLSRLQINSNPENAKIIIYAGSQPQKLPLDNQTPATVPLKKGKYGIQAQKPGFITSDIKQVSIDEYDKVYIPEAVQLNGIKVFGQVNITNNAGKTISIGGKTLDIRVTYSGNEVHKEPLSADARFLFEPKIHTWLNVGSEYEITVNGKAILSAEPVQFTYDGYSDIQVSMAIKIDDIPPILQQVTFDDDKIVLGIVLGDELKGSIKASDDGTGLDDVIDIQLQSPDGQITASISSSNIRFSKPDTYEFRYKISGEKSAVGNWKVFALAIKDKAGNQSNLSADQINAGFTVYENHYTLGRHYFDAEDYGNAMSHFKQFSPQDDDTLYMIALTHYNQGESEQALTTFQTIKTGTSYLGSDRKKDVPQMPRAMANMLWGRLLTNLKDHRADAGYISLLVVTAEELDRKYDAKVYKDYILKIKGVEK